MLHSPKKKTFEGSKQKKIANHANENKFTQLKVTSGGGLLVVDSSEANNPKSDYYEGMATRLQIGDGHATSEKGRLRDFR